MASIFKLRRGSGSVDLEEGELYVNYSSSLQYGDLDDVEVTLLPLSKSVSGDINLTGSINLSGSLSASYVYITNDLYVSGNLYLGNETTDKIEAKGEFQSHLIPNPTETYDLGSQSKKWKNLHANSVTASISGSINNIDITLFSTSVDGRLNLVEVTASYLNNTFSSSVNSRLDLVESTSSYLNTTFSTSVDSRLNVIEGPFSTSVDARLNVIEGPFSTSVDSRLYLVEVTASYLNTTFSSSVDERLGLAESTSSYLNNTFSSSVDNRLELVEATASYLNTTFSTSVDSRLETLENAATSDDGRLDALEAYSASLKTAISASGQDLIVYGNLTVQGTQTSLNVNEVFIEDKTLTLASGSATAAAADGAGIHIAGANVTMSWDNNNSRINLNKSFYVNGDLSGSTLIGIGNVTTYSTSVDARLNVVEASASLYIEFSTSVDSRLELVEVTASYLNNTFSSSVDSRLELVEATASALNTTFSSSVNSRLNSLQSYTASVSTSVGLLEATASYLNTTFSSSVDSRLDSVEAYTASVSTSVGLLQSTASYLNTTFSTSVDARLDGLEIESASFKTFTGSVFYPFSTSVDSRLNLTEATASYLNTTFSTSVDARLDNIEFSTASLSSWTGSTFNTFSYSVDLRLDGVEYTASLFGGGLIAQLDVINNATASLQLVSASLLTFTSSYYTDSASFNGRIVTLEQFSSSLNATFATDAELSAVSAAIAVRDAGQDTSITTLSSSVDARLDLLEEKDIIINLGGDLSGSGVSTNLGTVTLNGYITADSVALGTDTSGSYVHTIVGTANQITVAGSGVEKADITLSLPQNIHTSANPQFNSLGIGTVASTTAGEIRATGDITAFYSSDERLKQNIVSIPNALEKVHQISGNTFNWKEGYDEIHSHKGNDVGVIAQEIEQILPQIVTNRDNGFKAVQYEKIIPLLIEAIKELSEKVNSLENK